MLFLGNLVAQLMLAMILGICLRAFGESASFAGLLLVNTMVALFAGFMPVPGGMGVSEAALTAGLVALGVPNTAAMSTAIAYRLVTFYLPPIWARSRRAGSNSISTCEPRRRALRSLMRSSSASCPVSW